MQRFVNLCPHVMHLPNGESLPAAETPARCAEVDEPWGSWNGVPLIMRQYTEVTALPAQQPDVMLIVSLIVRNALPHRQDLCSPGTLIRDAEGNIIGCKNMAVGHPSSRTP